MPKSTTLTEALRQVLSEDGGAYPYTIPYRLQRGVAFRNAVFIRVPDGNGGSRVYMFTPESKGWDLATACPYRLTVDADYDPDVAREAFAWAEWLAADKHSADNLVRFFATPVLEPKKEATYVFYGTGANGTSLTVRALHTSFPSYAQHVEVRNLTRGGITNEEMRLSLLGKLWATEDDGPEYRAREIRILEKYSTGGMMQGRRFGDKPIDFKCEATFAVCTNGEFKPEPNKTSLRCFAYVRFRDYGGRDFHPYVNWLKLHGAVGWLMASCALWATYSNDRPWHDVSIVPSKPGTMV